MTPERWQIVKELLHKTLEASGETRENLLQRECAGDQSLRKELESLIASYEQDKGFLESPAVVDVKKPTGLLELESLPGQRVGPYKIIREIGQGGMGAVYLAARADDQFKQSVAIKLVRRGMDCEQILRRFRHERQILASLDHPNIARLLDGGTTNEGDPYL